LHMHRYDNKNVCGPSIITAIAQRGKDIRNA
jgi:hypothetical protein